MRCPRSSPQPVRNRFRNRLSTFPPPPTSPTPRSLAFRAPGDHSIDCPAGGLICLRRVPRDSTVKAAATQSPRVVQRPPRSSCGRIPARNKGRKTPDVTHSGMEIRDVPASNSRAARNSPHQRRYRTRSTDSGKVGGRAVPPFRGDTAAPGKTAPSVAKGEIRNASGRFQWLPEKLRQGGGPKLPTSDLGPPALHSKQ